MTGRTTRISVELTPRSTDALRADVATVKDHLTSVDTINVPDLSKFEMSSWDACEVAAHAAPGHRTIPHIRAQDLHPHRPLPMLDTLERSTIDEVLIVSGDEVHSGQSADSHSRVDAVQAISRVKRELPHVQVYAGLDPYRCSPAQELDYAQQKLAAGATGFFTQPFFDTALMQAWSGMLPPDVPVWWGATTVTSAASYNYWQQRNHVVFPTDFDLSLDWQRSYAQRAISFAQQSNQHIYMMPVRVDLRTYLGGLV